jgi:acyl dehydratase
VTREEIVDFAREFDPQPFHLGEAGNGLTEGLTASGWHVCGLFMRALCDGILLDAAPDRGIVRFRHEVANQAGERVVTMENPILFLVRPAA